MARESCHEPALFPSEAPSGTHEAKKTATVDCPGNTPRRNVATDRRLGTHTGEILPRPAAREYIASICCHGQAPQEKAEAARSAIYAGEWVAALVGNADQAAQRDLRGGAGLNP